MTNSDTCPIIYTQPGCTPCKAMVARFSSRGVPYELVDISEDGAAFDRMQQAGIASTPAFDLGHGLTTSVSAALAYVKGYHEEAA